MRRILDKDQELVELVWNCGQRARVAVESVPCEPKLVPVGTEPLADDSDTVPRMERHQHGHLLHRQHYARQLVAPVRQ